MSPPFYLIGYVMKFLIVIVLFLSACDPYEPIKVDVGVPDIAEHDLDNPDGYQDEPLLFRAPVEKLDDYSNIIIGVDHDPVDYDLDAYCTNYAGDTWPWCYDQHDGTDFMLLGGFLEIDNEHWVVAVADGVVIKVQDGYYDRCHAWVDDDGIYCDGHEMAPNYVSILHRDGTRTKYLHMKKSSIIVETHQDVFCGDRLGQIGSSGRSAAPHVHFEVYNAPEDGIIDPYFGWWVNGYPSESCE